MQTGGLFLATHLVHTLLAKNTKLRFFKNFKGVFHPFSELGSTQLLRQ
jgi:hypothetical protein